MHDITAGNLRSAYSGESQAHLRYKIWGARAEKDEYPNVARLFRAISHAEEVHGTHHFNELRAEKGAFMMVAVAPFGLGDTSQNLQGAIDGETFEVNEMYPTYLETAKFQGEKGAELSFHYAYTVEKTHLAMFQKAKRAVDLRRDVELGPVRICNVCGYTVEGDIPDKCPLCGVGKEMFLSFA